MGMHLIAALSWFLEPAHWLVVLQVAAGLGFVIFVHELGHFLVAKACGVKCEKFYLGFDIYGLKIAKFQCGETEYGIGILPLGGYVKMLGQDDNPARMAEETRARSCNRRAPPTLLPQVPTLKPPSTPRPSLTATCRRNQFLICMSRTILAVTWPKVYPNGWPSFPLVSL